MPQEASTSICRSSGTVSGSFRRRNFHIAWAVYFSLGSADTSSVGAVGKVGKGSGGGRAPLPGAWTSRRLGVPSPPVLKSTAVDPEKKELRGVSLRRRLIWGALAGAGVGALVAALAFFYPPFESLTLDARHKLLARPAAGQQQVAIAVVDDDSINALTAEDPDYRWPWPRALYGAITQFLTKAGARAV